MTYRLDGPYPEVARHIGAAQASGLPGAYVDGPNSARTFDWCQIDEPEGQGPVGYSVCMIDSNKPAGAARI